VAGADEFLVSQQKGILNYFSYMRIYNCIIFSQNYNKKANEYSRSISDNDAKTVMKLGMYTWFPYPSSDRCTEVNDITLLESWVISAQGHFTKKTDLFPRKVNKSFNRCPMKAFVRDDHWKFTVQYVNHTDSNVRYIEGLEMDLLRFVLQQMNMMFFRVPTPKGFEMDGESRKVISLLLC
jgi:hypothetical protein